MSGRGAAARVDAPRFDLRFEAGRGVVSLARPLDTPAAVVERLEMELDLDAAVQLSGGVGRFRHRRARVVDVRARLRPLALAAFAAERGVPLRIEGPRGGELWVSFRDAVGACAWRCVVATRGPDVLAYPLEVAFVRRGPVPPWGRVGRWVAALGGVWSPRLGAFVWRRPIRALLARSLLPHGWRVPDERGVALRWDASAPVIEAGEEEVAPNRTEEAVARAAALQARAHPWSDPSAMADGAAGRFERALRTGSLADAERAARAIAAAWVRADAYEALAERYADALDDEALGDLLLSALVERPNEPAAWRRWIDVLGEGGRLAALRLARTAVAGPLPRTTRASLAARAVDRVLDQADPEDLDAADELASELVEEAERLAPQLPEVMAARAALQHRHGDLSGAARTWERAAEETDDPSSRALWRRRAGELWLGLRGPAAAEPLLRRALSDYEVAGERVPTLIAQLAAVTAERGDAPGSRELFARLLREPRPQDEAWRAAALAAARWYVERGDEDRARPFLAALGADPASASVADAELSFVLGETFSWPGGGADELDEALSDESMALAILDGGDEGEDDVPHAPTQIARSSKDLSGVQVTLVAVADDEVRALLSEAREAADPAGVLDGALERALEDADPAGVRRVLRVLDRLDPFPGEKALRERAERLLEHLGDET